jgi:glutaredoxin-like protein
MALLNEQITEQLKQVFAQMKNPVEVVVVTKADNCETCADTTAFITELTDISENLKMTALDEGSARAKELGVERVPAIVLLGADGKDYGIKFYGIPAGHEINSFLMGILEVSGAGQALPEAMVAQIAAINKPVDIKVFVTLSCPHCPGAVAKAHKLALMSEHVKAEMIEANTFGELSNKYKVSGVPKIVINEKTELLGDQPIEAFLQAIGSL